MVKHALKLIFCFAVMQSSIVNAEQPAPSIELLEYLADLENTNNEWIDPLQMKEIAINQIEEPTLEKGDE